MTSPTCTAALQAAGYLYLCLESGSVPSGQEFLAIHDRREWVEEWAALRREARRIDRAVERGEAARQGRATKWL